MATISNKAIAEHAIALAMLEACVNHLIDRVFFDEWYREHGNGD